MKRYDHFQIVRGIACTMVFANHIFGLLSNSLAGTSAIWTAPFLVPMGFPWVWLFLVLSGFLLTKGFVDKRFSLDTAGIRKFSISRLYRLIPLLVVVEILWLVLYKTGVWSSQLPGFQWRREVNTLLALPWAPYFLSTTPIGSVNSAAWSAVIEIHFSLLLPTLFLWISLSQKKLAGIVLAWSVCIAALGCYVAYFTTPDIFPLWYGGHIYNVGFFLAGSVLATTPRFGHWTKKLPWSVVIGLAGAALLLTQYASFFHLNLTLALSPLPMLLAWCLLIARCDESYQAPIPGSPKGLLRNAHPLRILESIGMMSYSLYLVHKPLGYILIEKLHLADHVSSPASMVATGLLCFVLSLPVYVFLFVYVERRFRYRKPVPANTERTA